jgi:hypothetical protein
MMPKLRLAKSMIAAAALALGVSGPAAANDDDHREVSSYVLTEAGLAKYTRAARNLATIPGACAADKDAPDGASQSIDGMVAKIDAMPGAKAAIQSAGLQPREYVLFSFSMIQSAMSAWAVSQPGGKLPPGVSQANVDFYKKHEAAIAALGENDPCKDDADDSGE